MKRWTDLPRYALLLVAVAAPLRAAVFTVTTTQDTFDGICDAQCSLRDAVSAANADPAHDDVLLAPGTYVLARAGAGEDGNATGDLDVHEDVTILGAGAGSTVLDGGGLDRVLEIHDLARVAVVGLTIRNGNVVGSGGGIASHGLLELRRALVRDNAATGNGGGIADSALSASIFESTIADNVAGERGGGLWECAHLEQSTLSGNRARRGGGFAHDEVCQLLQVTIADNEATELGGGFESTASSYPSCVGCGPPATTGGTLIAGNRAPLGADCYGPLYSLGYNVVGNGEDCSLTGADRFGNRLNPVDARLGPLGDHGGPTPTLVPAAGSPAIDFVAGGTPVPCGKRDQRGVARPDDGDGDGVARCDAGAVEVTPQCLTTGTELCIAHRFLVSATFTPPAGTEASAHSLPLAADTGAFWFFSPGNLELMVKVLDGCASGNHWWVFASGLTDVAVTLRVRDLTTGSEKTYPHAGGTPFPPTLDTAAFGCP